MRRRSYLAALATAASAGCVRGPDDVAVGTPSADQYRRDPLADCDLADPPALDAASVHLTARLLSGIRREAPVVRSDAPGFESLSLFQELFEHADEASEDAGGEFVRTGSVSGDAEEARRAVAAKECLPQPTFVVRGDWILSVAVIREGVTES